MSTQFNEHRSEAIRAGLVESVVGYRAPRRPAWRAVALVVIGALAGSGVATAAFATGTVRPLALPGEVTASPGNPGPSGGAQEQDRIRSGYIDSYTPGSTYVILDDDPNDSGVNISLPTATSAGSGNSQISEISLADHSASATSALVTVECLGTGPISMSSLPDQRQDPDPAIAKCESSGPPAIQFGRSERPNNVLVVGGDSDRSHFLKVLIGFYDLESTTRLYVTTPTGATAKVQVRYLVER